jgi:hypothetical protein
MTREIRTGDYVIFLEEPSCADIQSVGLIGQDSRLESFFGGRGVGRLALEQDFAAGPVKLRFERAVAEAIGRHQRLIEGRNGANAIARPLGQRDLQEPVEIQEALLAPALGDAAHVAEPLAERAALSRRQALEKSSERSPQRPIMLTPETGSLRTVLSRARSVASHQFEHRRMVFRIRVRADMRHPRGSLVRAVNKRYRA